MTQVSGDMTSGEMTLGRLDRLSFVVLQFKCFVLYTEVKWLQTGGCVLWQENDFNLREFAVQIFWMAWSIAYKKNNFAILSSQTPVESPWNFF